MLIILRYSTKHANLWVGGAVHPLKKTKIIKKTFKKKKKVAHIKLVGFMWKFFGISAGSKVPRFLKNSGKFLNITCY